MKDCRQLDADLLGLGVRFLPWIGQRYELGFGGQRLLILGESHYPWEDDDRELTDPLPPEVTRDCVSGVITREVWVGDFWKYLEQAHLNVQRWEMAPNGDEFWQSIAFYNFVQVPVGTGPRQAPRWCEFVDARSAFRAVIQALKPERIVVCGKRLWGAMEDTPGDLFLHNDIQGYRLPTGDVAWCLATVHPSSGRYSWRRLHPVIDAFIADPRRAQAILSGSTSIQPSPTATVNVSNPQYRLASEEPKPLEDTPPCEA